MAFLGTDVGLLVVVLVGVVAIMFKIRDRGQRSQVGYGQGVTKSPYELVTEYARPVCLEYGRK